MWSDTQRIQTQLLNFLGIFAPFICFHFTIYCKVHSLITDQGCVKWWPLSLFAFMENRFPRNCWSNISALGANCCRLINKTFIQRMISFVVDNNWQWLTMQCICGTPLPELWLWEILELWVKMESFFKRAMLPFFCCNSATINAWSKSKCSACFIFVVTWLNFICWFTWQLRRLGESRLHCLNRSTLWAVRLCCWILFILLRTMHFTSWWQTHYGYLPPKEEPKMFWLWKQCHRHRELAPNSLLLDLLLPTHFYHPWHHMMIKIDIKMIKNDHQTPHLPFSFLLPAHFHQHPINLIWKPISKHCNALKRVTFQWEKHKK